MTEEPHNETEATSDLDFAAELAELPRGLEPDHDLWPGIESRLTANVAGREHERRVVRLWPALAVGLAAAAAIAIWWTPSLPDVEGDRSSRVEPPVPQQAPTAAPELSPDTYLLPGEDDYRSAAALLAAAIEDRRSQLSPDVVDIYDDNLGVVDHAIASSRAALTDRPEDEQLLALLDDAYQQKLDLLEQVVAVPGRP